MFDQISISSFLKSIRLSIVFLLVDTTLSVMPLLIILMHDFAELLPHLRLFPFSSCQGCLVTRKSDQKSALVEKNVWAIR